MFCNIRHPARTHWINTVIRTVSRLTDLAEPLQQFFWGFPPYTSATTMYMHHLWPIAPYRLPWPLSFVYYKRSLTKMWVVCVYIEQFLLYRFLFYHLGSYPLIIIYITTRVYDTLIKQDDQHTKLEICPHSVRSAKQQVNPHPQI